MKIVKLTLIILCITLLNSNVFCQKGGHKGKSRSNIKHQGRHHQNKIVVRRSHYRPNKIVVYHPYWHPNYSYNRRWVYFPKYNLYWDNWRNHYVYYNGGIWLSQPTAPAIIINVNLDKEKNYELKDSEEDDDDVYKKNETHKTEYKPE